MDNFPPIALIEWKIFHLLRY